MDHLLDLAMQLISHPSLTPEDAGCQALLAKELSAMGFNCEPMRFGEVDNLWARYGQAKPLFVFAGHTDVVPTGPLPEWTSPPFQPEIRHGNLYGRGACDMKAAIAAMIVATKQFIEKSPNFPGSIAFLLTSDEEGVAVDGTVKVMEVLQKRGEKIDYCLIGEPSSDQQVGDQIRVGRRGSLHGKLVVYGKQGHVAHPHLADNPVHKSLLALHELAGVSWDTGNAFYPPTTFQISNIHAGNGATNVIPGHLEVLCNFRFSTAVTPAKLQQQAETILKKHGLQYKMDWKTSALPFLSQQGRLITTTQQAIAHLTGLSVKLSTGGGTSDGRFIAPTGAEVVELGVRHATAHQINEYTNLQELAKLAQIYQHILKGVFHP